MHIDNLNTQMLIHQKTSNSSCKYFILESRIYLNNYFIEGLLLEAQIWVFQTQTATGIYIGNMFIDSEVIELEKCKSCWDSNEVKLLSVCALATEVNPIILDCFQWYLLTGEANSSLSWWLLMCGWEWIISSNSLLSDLLQVGILEEKMVNFRTRSICLATAAALQLFQNKRFIELFSGFL